MTGKIKKYFDDQKERGLKFGLSMDSIKDLERAEVLFSKAIDLLKRTEKR